jgi:hypothetical protein
MGEGPAGAGGGDESRLKLSRLIFADFALRPVGRNVQRQRRRRRDDRPARHHAEVLTLTGDSYRTRASRELLAKDNRTGE